MFTPEQIQELECICDDPFFLEDAKLLAFVSQVRERPKPGVARKELQRVIDTLDKLSQASKADLGLYMRDESMNFVVDDWRQHLVKAIDCLDDRGRPGARERRDLGLWAQQLFEHFNLPLRSDATGEFVTFLDILIEAAGTGWSGRHIAWEILSKDPE